jgi:threonylcarbamoyladenosine tRNA methylthiotransferase CDKAL1
MKRIYFHTFGCTANFYESEAMAGMLTKVGYEIVGGMSNDVSFARDANLMIVNICTVKGNKTALDALKDFYSKFSDKKFVITGCIPKDAVSEIKEIVSNASFCSTTNMMSIVEVVEEALAGSVVEALKYKREVKVNLPRIRRNKVIGITPILQGCAHFCTFCSTRLVKGRVLSYPMDEVIADVKQNIADGCKEIWLTSQDNGTYMLDHEKVTMLPELLEAICSLEGDFKVRLGMMNPTHIIPVVDKLVEVFKNEKMFKFIHIPIQAGSDSVLDRMRRQHTVEEFRVILERFRKVHPNLTVSTDIICGFPGETDHDFNETLNVVREMKFDIVNLARFAPRPMTLAAKMENQISGGVKKERSREITEVYRKICLENNQKWLDWSGIVAISEEASYSHGVKTWVARNYAYKHVLIKGNYKLGDELRVKVNSVSRFDLHAEEIEEIVVKSN